MAAWRAMPDGGKGGSYKLQLYHEKHPHQGTPRRDERERKRNKDINENIRYNNICTITSQSLAGDGYVRKIYTYKEIMIIKNKNNKWGSTTKKKRIITL